MPSEIDIQLTYLLTIHFDDFFYENLQSADILWPLTVNKASHFFNNKIKFLTDKYMNEQFRKFKIKTD